jgi:2,4-dienoyl-CoA reductase (NADPH2)
LEDPLGCYDVTRFDGDHDAMIAEVMSFFDPQQAADSTAV